ncbi:hypothetical protein [Desulfofundulus sp.]|uniref:hypothetical protein n=1 Tax=Desulfofundulus sp. TaxID=2282750 RepID=UPI003C74FA27
MIFKRKRSEKQVPFEDVCAVLRYLAGNGPGSSSAGGHRAAWNRVVEVIVEPDSSDIVSLISPTVARSLLAQALVMVDPACAGLIVSRAGRCVLDDGFQVFDWCDLSKEFLCACGEKEVVTAVERAVGACLPVSCGGCESKPCLSNVQVTVQFGGRKFLEMVLRSLIDDDRDRFEKVDAFFRGVLVPAVDVSFYDLPPGMLLILIRR